jgi:putative transcriptional regulator
VDPQIGFVLHSVDYHSDDDVDIDGRVALTSGPEILRDIGLGKGPQQSLVAFGYAGWGPSQLDDELLKGVWTVVPEDPALVFDDDRTNVWTDAMARHKPAR